MPLSFKSAEFAFSRRALTSLIANPNLIGLKLCPVKVLLELGSPHPEAIRVTPHVLVLLA